MNAPPTSDDLNAPNEPSQTIGIESFSGFGDCLFNVPLIETVIAKFDAEVIVAIHPRYSDAFNNVPGIKVKRIEKPNDGIEYFKQIGVPGFQITQRFFFYEYIKEDPQHSLALTSWKTGTQLFKVEFNPRPRFYPTTSELSCHAWIEQNVINVAIESEYHSNQSWASDGDLYDLIKGNPSIRFFWLSLRKPPFTLSNVIYAPEFFTRRECIVLASKCPLFISVGSGIFCGVVALLEQPKHVWMLWDDGTYQYRKTMTERGWLPETTIWFGSRDHWQRFQQHSNLGNILELPYTPT